MARKPFFKRRFDRRFRPDRWLSHKALRFHRYIVAKGYTPEVVYGVLFVGFIFFCIMLRDILEHPPSFTRKWHWPPWDYSTHPEGYFD